MEELIKKIKEKLNQHNIYKNNTVNKEEDIDNFLALHRNRKGVKILIFKMNTMEMITFEQVKDIIHTAHMFDYLRQLISDGNQLLQVEDIDKIPISTFIKYLATIEE